MGTIISQVEELRRRKGISLSALAMSCGISKANLSAYMNERRDPGTATVEKLAAGLGLALVPVDLTALRLASDCADVIRVALLDGDEDRAYDALRRLAEDLDRFPALASLLTTQAPTKVSDEWDAAIAGVVEWKVEQAGLPAPAWATSNVRARDREWAPLAAPSVEGVRPEDVPLPLLERGILLDVYALG